MIRVSVLYANSPGAKFDLEYYVGKHLALVRDRLQPLGLVRAEIDKGLGGGAPDAPAPYGVVGHLYFNSLEGFQKAFATHGQELMADIPNFTDISPLIQISEIAVS